MTEDIVYQCAESVRDTCHLLMRAVGFELGSRPAADLSLAEVIVLLMIEELQHPSLGVPAARVERAIDEAGDIVDSLAARGYVVFTHFVEGKRRPGPALTSDGREALRTENSTEVAYLRRVLADPLADRVRDDEPCDGPHSPSARKHPGGVSAPSPPRHPGPLERRPR